MLPILDGRPIRIELRRSLGPHLAATSIPKRRILLDREVLAHRGDFERILVHEIFHFTWVRLGNPKRQSWESLLAIEISAAVPGELGWSAEWRRNKLSQRDIRARTPKWRRYLCESFCDSAAWCYSGLDHHDEFTLPASWRARRRKWFEREFSVVVPV